VKRFSLLRLGALVVLALAAFNPGLKADEHDRKAILSISQPLEVPGVVLVPGTYAMKLFNSSNSRHIVQIMNQEESRQPALTFAVFAAPISQSEQKEPETTTANRDVAAAEQPSTTSESLPQTAGEGPLAAPMGSLAMALALGMWKIKRNRIL
jgi:hypothetical protein